jgi:sugar phosphate permease
MNTQKFHASRVALTAIPMSLIGITPSYGLLLILVFVSGIYGHSLLIET